jgi:hypothetical protein
MAIFSFAHFKKSVAYADEGAAAALYPIGFVGVGLVPAPGTWNGFNGIAVPVDFAGAVVVVAV